MRFKLVKCVRVCVCVGETETTKASVKNRRIMNWSISVRQNIYEVYLLHKYPKTS